MFFMLQNNSYLRLPEAHGNFKNIPPVEKYRLQALFMVTFIITSVKENKPCRKTKQRFPKIPGSAAIAAIRLSNRSPRKHAPSANKNVSFSMSRAISRNAVSREWITASNRRSRPFGPG
jgi:hypothetical protein